MAERENNDTPVTQITQTQRDSLLDQVRAWLRGRLSLIICVCLIAVIGAVYWPVGTHDFILFDDDAYVTENPQVTHGLSLKGVVWAFTATRAHNWHPLTWLSHMLDCQIYGLGPGGHHMTNLLFHLASMVLLFLVFRRMTGRLWQSWFIAALFALHPLHVQSVAWVAERKDVLSTFFWMLTMGAYVRYTERPAVNSYLLVILFFVLGLMSKPMLVTLPFVLLLLDYWPLGRLQPEQWRNQALPLIREKIPLFVLSAASSLVTFLVQQGTGAVRSMDILPLGIRIANALVSYVSYIGKMILPQHLAVLYPYPDAIPPAQPLGAGLLVASISVLVIRFAKNYPYLLVGWFWYLGTLVPVIGLVQVGEQALADRYTYVPLIGLFVMVSMGVPEMLTRWRVQKIIFAVSTGLVLLLLMVMTRAQVSHWRGTEALFNHALAVTSHNFLIHNNLGVALERQGRIEEAINQYREVVRLKPGYAVAHLNLANVLSRQGKVDEAISHYIEALKLRPDFAEAHNAWGLAFKQQGRNEEAIAHYEEALKINSEYAEARINLGVALEHQGRIEEALAQYKEAVRLNPRSALGHFNLGNVLFRLGRLPEAMVQYADVLRIKPDHVEAHNNWGVALERQGSLDEAITHFTEALRIKPDHAGAHNNLANAFFRQGKIKEALAHFSEALKIKPDFVEAYKNLGGALAQSGKPQEAIAQYTNALQINPDDAEAHFSLGLAYVTVGDRNLAFQEYKVLRAIDPDLAHRLLERIPGW